MSNEPVRIDKFLWAVRLFKTRSIATDECRRGKIVIGNTGVKPSRIIAEGEIINVRKAPVTFTFRVKALTQKRVAARLVADFIDDLTPEEEKLKLIIRPGEINAFREKGLGRPTKRERRLIDRLREDSGLG